MRVLKDLEREIKEHKKCGLEIKKVILASSSYLNILNNSKDILKYNNISVRDIKKLFEIPIEVVADEKLHGEEFILDCMGIII